MRALMDSDGGFANFRARLEQTVNPCIPYMCALFLLLRVVLIYR